MRKTAAELNLICLFQVSESGAALVVFYLVVYKKLWTCTLYGPSFHKFKDMKWKKRNMQSQLCLTLFLLNILLVMTFHLKA